MANNIKCPNCGFDIELTEALAGEDSWVDHIFSKNQNDLQDGRKINDTGIFFETKLSTNNIKELCDTLSI